MYKILIKKTSTPRNLFEPYAETTEGEESTTEFQTDDLTELAEKYKELLNISCLTYEGCAGIRYGDTC